jgi:hypothetical protein
VELVSCQCGTEVENHEKTFLKMGTAKNPIRNPNGQNHQANRKAKERPRRQVAQRNQRRERASPSMVGSYLTHNPSNFTCMQIMKSDSNRRSSTNISHQCNLPIYIRDSSTLNISINMILEKLIANRQG